MSRDLAGVVAIAAVIGAAVAWAGWRIVRPVEVPPEPRPHVRRAAAAAAVAAVAGIGGWIGGHAAHTSSSRPALSFSSHWHALAGAAARATPGEGVGSSPRLPPRAGERRIDAPRPGNDPANVVVILLESVSHAATSLAGTQRDTTPHLAALAGQGVEFVTTRVPIARTTKAHWAVMTGSHASARADSVEAALADQPYESLASILRRAGYRSAYFEMGRGSFECAPGLLANLDIDRAWFRENLEDDTAHLGYMNGDDLRMLDPMFEWVDGGDEPFLLAMITSVAHDPYEVPDWFETRETGDDRPGRYLDAVRCTDAFVGEVCRRLAARGLADRTLVCVIGDHGDSFRPGSPRGRWAPYEEVIRVPWVIRLPGRVEAGRRVEWPCSQLDVTPTILGLLGYGIDDAGFDGRDALVPGPADRRLFFATLLLDSPLGFVEGNRKLVYWPSSDTLFEFDLASDPDESSPTTVNEQRKPAIIDAVRRWRADSLITVPPKRFRRRVLFEHWHTFSSGDFAWTYYEP